MSKIKLVYFDFNFWRIDILRLSLAYAGIDYDLKESKKDWTKFKDKQPLVNYQSCTIKDKFIVTHSLATFVQEIKPLQYDEKSK